MIKHSRVSAWSRRSRTEQPTLSPDEQSELALKLRYGIGIEQLTSEPFRKGPPTAHKPPPAPADPPRAPRSDTEVRSRAASLGITAGTRGQWLRR